MCSNDQEPRHKPKPVGVMVELRVPENLDPDEALGSAHALTGSSFRLDESYTPVPVSAPPDDALSLEAAGQALLLVRGTIDPTEIPDLEARAGVARVWRDTPVEPFSGF